MLGTTTIVTWERQRRSQELTKKLTKELDRPIEQQPPILLQYPQLIDVEE